MRPANQRTRRDSHPIIVTPSLLERAFEEATADGVTGLPQRAQFMSLLRHELRQRKRRNVCVAYVDLDHFKAVNDAHGHARGDEVLRALARSARGSLREGDVLARIGGDEFAVIAPGAGEGGATRLAAELLEAVRSAGIEATVAWAVHPADGRDGESLLRAADRRLYEGKALVHA
jgi:diguanylate cyclase (GGDEF)-like protein